MPAVSFREALESQMLVTELLDVLVVGASLNLFGRPPNLRPLTPAIAEAHAKQRAEWALLAAELPRVQDISEAGWKVVYLDDGVPRVLDLRRYWMATPTHIEPVPVLFSFLEHKAHGRKPRARVDDGDWHYISRGQNLLAAMLAGKTVLVEFFQDPDDEPRFARFDLTGFAAAWNEACALVPIEM